MESLIKIIKEKDISWPVPQDYDLQEYYDKGVIPKEQLEHGAYYRGICRNSTVARWNAYTEEMWYMRYKFGWRKDKINYISDDDGFDLFLALDKLPLSQVPKESIIEKMEFTNV